MPLDTSASAMPRLKRDAHLASLGKPGRIWAVGSIKGRYGALMQLHNVLEKRLQPRDGVVYLGNYLGAHSLWTGEGLAVLDELIGFRNALIAVPGFFAADVVHLLGRTEDLFRHVRRLPFQKNHAAWLADALAFGLEASTLPYGTDAQELLALGHKGIHAMNSWCHQLNQRLGAHSGHFAFFEHLKTAACTEKGLMGGRVALVPAGFDAAFGLSLQHDTLCWPETDVADAGQWQDFTRVVRGQSFRPEPPQHRKFVLTLDDGLEMDGRLWAVCLDGEGQILDQLQFG